MRYKTLLFRLVVMMAAVMCTLGASAQEAYACYTSSNRTLTFYYDTQRSSRTGTKYNLNTGDDNPDWSGSPTTGSILDVTHVVFDPSFASVRPTSTHAWFYYMVYVETITGLNYLNTSEVTDMAYMFANCIKLTGLDLNHFNTDKVTDMNHMFSSNAALTSLDLSSFNTSDVTDMRAMFHSCSNLQTIYVGNGWNTSAVTVSSAMFQNCTSLVGGQGTVWNSSNPRDKTYAHIDGGPSNPGYFTGNSAGLRGDVNGDHEVTISDAIMLISAIVNDDFSGVNMVNADVNYSGTVDISDAIMLINAILNESWP